MRFIILLVFVLACLFSAVWDRLEIVSRAVDALEFDSWAMGEWRP